MQNVPEKRQHQAESEVVHREEDVASDLSINNEPRSQQSDKQEEKDMSSHFEQLDLLKFQ